MSHFKALGDRFRASLIRVIRHLAIKLTMSKKLSQQPSTNLSINRIRVPLAITISH